MQPFFVCGFKLLQLRHHSLKTHFNNEQCCKRIEILQISSFLVEKVSNTGMESSLAPKKIQFSLAIVDTPFNFRAFHELTCNICQ